jgi:hypothetical protein
MTTRKIVIRCFAVVFAFAALGFLLSLPSDDRYGYLAEIEYDSGSLDFWKGPLSGALYLGSIGLSIAICVGGGSALLRGIRSGLFGKWLAFVFMLGFSIAATILPSLLVAVVFANNGGGHPDLVLPLLSFCIGVSGFLLFGFASSLKRSQ